MASDGQKIEVECSCGKTLNVSNRLAGKQGRCPTCRAVIQIPDGANTPLVPLAVSPADDPFGTEPFADPRDSINPSPVGPAPIPPEQVQAPAISTPMPVVETGVLVATDNLLGSPPTHSIPRKRGSRTAGSASTPPEYQLVLALGYVLFGCSVVMFMGAVFAIIYGIANIDYGGGIVLLTGFGLIFQGLVTGGTGGLVLCIRDMAQNSFCLRSIGMS